MTPGSPQWSPARRLAFRLLFVYLLLYASPLDFFDDGGSAFWQAVVPRAGTLLGLPPITIFPNGSGDTTFNYVQVLCFAVLAIAIAVPWALLDRKGRHDGTLLAGLRVYVRYLLAYTLLSYGMIKVFKSQFPFPSPGTLLQPIGDASPMRLLWTFMGYSTAYTMFAGAGEVLAGVLLMFRRTTLAGALVGATVMANVAILNFSYDVPVKLYSTHLLLMCVFLAAPDTSRLVRFFVLNRPVLPVPERARGWIGFERARLVLKTLVVGTLLVSTTSLGWTSWRAFGDAAPASPLAGAYDVQEPGAWRQVTLSRNGAFSLYGTDGKKLNFRTRTDDANHTLELTRRADKVATLRYEAGPEGLRQIQGSVEGVDVNVRLRRRDDASFVLVSRGFHWVNEYPFNN